MPKNSELSVHYWRLAFSKNGSLSKYAAANIEDSYLRAECVAQRSCEPMDWLRIAAELGHLESQYNYGLALINGAGTDESHGKGIEWLNIAAKSGLPEAAAALQKLSSI